MARPGAVDPERHEALIGPLAAPDPGDVHVVFMHCPRS